MKKRTSFVPNSAHLSLSTKTTIQDTGITKKIIHHDPVMAVSVNVDIAKPTPHYGRNDHEKKYEDFS